MRIVIALLMILALLLIPIAALAQPDVPVNDLEVHGNVNTDLIPGTSGAHDLGSSSLKWGDAFVGGLVEAGSIKVPSEATGGVLVVKMDAEGDFIYEPEAEPITNMAVTDADNDFSTTQTGTGYVADGAFVTAGTGLAWSPAYVDEIAESASEVTGSGTQTWTDPTNAAAPNTAYASATIGTASTYTSTHRLRFELPDMNLPDGVTVSSVKLLITGYKSAGTTTVILNGYYMVSGSQIGAGGSPQIILAESPSEVSVTLTNPTTLSVAQWNSGDAQIEFYLFNSGNSITAYIDSVTVKIEYETTENKYYRVAANALNSLLIGYGGIDEPISNGLTLTTGGDLTVSGDIEVAGGSITTADGLSVDTAKVALGGGTIVGTSGFSYGTGSSSTGLGFAAGFGSQNHGSYGTAIGLNSDNYGYAGAVISDNSTNYALTGGILGGGHNTIYNKGSNIAGPYSGSAGADSAIVGSAYCKIWGLRNLIGSSFETDLNGDYGTALGSLNALVSDGQDYMTLINAHYDTPTSVTGWSYVTQHFSEDHAGVNHTFGEVTATGEIRTSDTVTANAFVGDGSGLTNLPGGTLDSDLTALANNSTNGLWARTGAGTGAARTITAGNGISVTNGDGVSGNPTVAISSPLSTTYGGTGLAGVIVPPSRTDMVAFIPMETATPTNQVGTPEAATVTGSPTLGRYSGSSGRPSIGKALSFSGTGQYLTYSNIPKVGTSDFTVAVWFKTASSSAQTLVADFTGTYSGWMIRLQTTGLFRIYIGASFLQGDIGSSGLNDGNWHLGVWTFDRDGNCTQYIDGVSQGTLSISAKSADNLSAGTFRIANRTDNVELWTGEIDDYWQWNGYAMSAAEVRGLYLGMWQLKY